MRSAKKKVCRSCGEEYPESQFFRRSESYGGVRHVCKKCHVLKRYGITMKDVALMMKNQENKCCICSMEFHEDYLVDHDHETGKVRGLLCLHCNTGIGMLKHNENFLLNAVSYLRKT